MQYSLLSRFRGVLLGSFIGERLCSNGIQGRGAEGLWLTSPPTQDTQSNQILSDWSQIATYGIQSLIRCGYLNLDDWMQHINVMQPSLLVLNMTASSSEVAVATLPMALFFHDNEVKLQQQMLKATSVWQNDSQASQGALAVAYAIALALTEQLNAHTVIPKTLAYLGTTPTPLTQQLEQVQTLLEQGAGLDTTLTQLRRGQTRGGKLPHSPYTSIALAFYCFLSTPDDFRLCVSRAVRSGYQPQITVTLTGALAGAYTSITGIPVRWYLAANRISVGGQRLQLADRLLAVWSGAYDISAIKPCQQAAVAAPSVIQPRAAN